MGAMTMRLRCLRPAIVVGVKSGLQAAGDWRMSVVVVMERG